MGQVTDARVGFRTKTFRSALTRPADTTAYAAGDVVSAVTTNDHFTFGADSDSNTKVPGRPGLLTLTLNSVRLFSSANQSTKMQAELWLFHTDIAEVADNAAFAPTDAEMLTCVAVVPIPTAAWLVGKADSGADGNATAFIDNIDIPVRASGDGILYGQLVVRNAYTPVSGQVITCDIIVSQD